MVLEQQVCSLNLAKKLREQGVYGKCIFGYILIPPPTIGIRIYWRDEQHALVSGATQFFNSTKISNRWCAPSVAELGVMLPDYVICKKNGNTWSCYIDDEKIVDGLTRYSYGFFKTEGKSQAEAMSKILIALLYYRIISAESVNKSVNS